MRFNHSSALRLTAFICAVGVCVLSISAVPDSAREGDVSWPAKKNLLLHMSFDKGVKPMIAWAGEKPPAQPKAPHAPTFVKGIRGTAAQFDGKDDFMLLPALRNVKLKQFTLEAWIKAGRGKRGCLFVSMGDTGKSGIRFEKFYSAMGFRLGDGKKQYPCYSSEYLIETGFWQHVAATYDGRRMRIFLNGKQIASADGPTAIGSCNTPIRVGAYINPRHYVYGGLLDEMVLFDRAKTADEIFDDMARCLRGKPK